MPPSEQGRCPGKTLCMLMLGIALTLGGCGDNGNGETDPEAEARKEQQQMQQGFPRQSVYQQPAPIYVPVYPQYPDDRSVQPGYQGPAQEYRGRYQDQYRPPPSPERRSNPWAGGGQAQRYDERYAGQSYWSSGPPPGLPRREYGQQGYVQPDYRQPDYAPRDYAQPRYRPLEEEREEREYREPQRSYIAPYDRVEGSSQRPGYTPGGYPGSYGGGYPGYGPPYGGYGYLPGYSTGVPMYGAPGLAWPGY